MTENDNNVEQEQLDALKVTGAKKLRTSRLGTYVYRRSNGKILANEDGDMLALVSWFGDKAREENVRQTAHKILWREGHDISGKVEFLDGQYPCTDEELLEQIYEFKEQGLI